MRILICTQAVDTHDPILGFFHRWIEEFAKHCEQVTVIAQRTGTYALPPNVTVISLGKEQGVSKPQQALRFLKLIWDLRGSYDSVFVHMSPEYVLAGGVLWQLLGRHVALWYTHKDVSSRLRAAVVLADTIVTASKESFRLPTPKVRVMGHGIDTDVFKPGMPTEAGEVRILTVGRISATKRLREMLSVLDVLHRRGERFSFTIVGKPMTAAELVYAKELEREIATRPFASAIHIIEGVDHAKLPDILARSDIFLNFSTTGSLDKAVLEAMATSLPVITSNEAFKPILERHGLWVEDTSAMRSADAIQAYLGRGDKAALKAKLRDEVVTHHSLARLIPAMLKELA